MINWDAHACLPQHPLADFTPVRRLHAAGVNYVSLNVGGDMNPVSQVMSVIAGYRATIAANPELYMLVSSVDDIIKAAAAGRMAISFDLEGAMPLLARLAGVDAECPLDSEVTVVPPTGKGRNVMCSERHQRVLPVIVRGGKSPVPTAFEQHDLI